MNNIATSKKNICIIEIGVRVIRIEYYFLLLLKKYKFELNVNISVLSYGKITKG